MGYRCPVCGDPQADATHLANHLAFTALARGGDHEAWLDEHVPDWADSDEAALADAVAPLADEREFPQVFEDTTGSDRDGADHDHGHDHGHGHGRVGTGAGDRPPAADPATLAEGGDRDVDAEAVLEAARDLTERRRTDDDSETE